LNKYGLSAYNNNDENAFLTEGGSDDD
jgi:hypothetical protein